MRSLLSSLHICSSWLHPSPVLPASPRAQGPFPPTVLLLARRDVWIWIGVVQGPATRIVCPTYNRSYRSRKTPRCHLRHTASDPKHVPKTPRIDCQFGTTTFETSSDRAQHEATGSIQVDTSNLESLPSMSREVNSSHASEDMLVSLCRCLTSRRSSPSLAHISTRCPSSSTISSFIEG
ncbi:hypothetical protein BJ875DRAFT_475369 [Amylocarpus encephaloides]|uniref:Uncharacterized protein n=1 Tax=Amylocarpus encephaloides TaxID=45428 RepID=A0A9P7Y9D5_9HELO|nr:hypothetical protein BJ875DRAFT_475369 [Amylocarpus encephaloides]